jgi:hypothetical protein
MTILVSLSPPDLSPERVDANVGTDDDWQADDATPITGMLIELTAVDSAYLLDTSRDLASMLCGRNAVALATLWRWPCVAILVLGAAAPVILSFVLHWANGGVGQFAPAYYWPMWLDMWVSVGWSFAVLVLLLWYATLQRELAWMSLKQVSTMWIIAMTGLFIAGFTSLMGFGIHKNTWATVPTYMGCALFFPLVAMADALPVALRLPLLKFCGPFAFGAAALIALVLRLPTAQETPGRIVWTVMGIETFTNLQAVTSSCTVIAVLLAKGVLRVWLHPHRLAFIQANIAVRQRQSAQ